MTFTFVKYRLLSSKTSPKFLKYQALSSILLPHFLHHPLHHILPHLLPRFSFSPSSSSSSGFLLYDPGHTRHLYHIFMYIYIYGPVPKPTLPGILTSGSGRCVAAIYIYIRRRPRRTWNRYIYIYRAGPGALRKNANVEELCQYGGSKPSHYHPQLCNCFEEAS